MSLAALFVLVKNKNDLFYYAIILVIANVGSNIFNFFRLRKYILVIPWKELNLWKHLKTGSTNIYFEPDDQYLCQPRFHHAGLSQR